MKNPDPPPDPSPYKRTSTIDWLERVFQFTANLIMLISGVLWLIEIWPKLTGWTCLIAGILLAGEMLFSWKFFK